MANYTWGEIQISAIQKMFLNNTNVVVSDLPTMRTDNKYKTYLNAMPQVANEGLLDLMRRGRPTLKEFKLTQFPIENSLGHSYMDTFQYTGSTIQLEGGKAKSYYFEVDNKSTIKIYKKVGEVLTVLETINHSAINPGTFVAYKNFIDNVDDDTIVIEFSGTNPYNYRYIALYEYDYKYELVTDIEYIPDYLPLRRYNLNSLMSDFYKIKDIVIEKEFNNPITSSDWRLEGTNILCLDSTLGGSWNIFYEAYPAKITSATTDATIINVSDEMIVLLPLYIASALFKDDNPQMATLYRNEYEAGLDEVFLIGTELEYISNSGWL